MNLAQLVDQLYQQDLKINPQKDRTIDHRVDLYDHYYSREGSTNNILCCVGDSWTRGWGLADYTTQSFGAQASKQLGWSWLNAGGSGFSNSWQLNNFEFLVDFLNTSTYDSGAVVLTLTENGRDITDYSSRRFDYINAYQHLPNTAKLYDLILNDIEQEWVDRLLLISAKLHSRFQIIVGTNFATHAYLTKLEKQSRIQYIKTSWLELLGCSAKARLISTEHLDTVGQILSLTDNLGLKQWIVEHGQPAIDIKDFMAKHAQYFDPHDTLHPNQLGHTVWADKIIEVLTL